jgi:hypothetical protein
MIDRYTKAVLTVIAAALMTLAVERIVPGASAQSGGCGDSSQNACFIRSSDPLEVRVTQSDFAPALRVHAE